MRVRRGTGDGGDEGAMSYSSGAGSKTARGGRRRRRRERAGRSEERLGRRERWVARDDDEADRGMEGTKRREGRNTEGRGR